MTTAGTDAAQDGAQAQQAVPADVRIDIGADEY